MHSIVSLDAENLLFVDTKNKNIAIFAGNFFTT